MEKGRRQLSLVIPIYKSADHVTRTVDRCIGALESFTTEFEIILVNDGSPDDSWRVIRELARGDNRIRSVNLARNYGQHNALICGIRMAKFSICATMDDDLQFAPEDIEQLVGKLDEGFDVVYGTPRRQQHGLFRNLFSRLVKLTMSTVLGGQTARKISSFRVFRTSLREAFRDASGDYLLLDALLSWGTSKFSFVKVEHLERAHGASNYTLAKLVLTAINLITSYTTIPLRIATVNGLLCVAIGLLLLVYVMGPVILGRALPGFPFLASVLIIFSGAQLFALGVIGEYLGRMYVRDLKRPAYFIETIEEFSASAVERQEIDFSVPSMSDTLELASDMAPELVENSAP